MADLISPDLIVPPDADRSAVRAVIRALQLLRLMNTRASWALAELHLATGLPKSTLSRLLNTLAGEGYVRGESPGGIYRLTGRVRELGAGYTESTRVVELGRPILLAVTRQIKWPLALGVLDTDAIVVRFSSMPYSPLAVGTTTLGHRLELLTSAMGRAWLAACSPTELAVLLDLLSAGADDPALLPEGWIRQDLDAVRAAGCAVRQPSAARGSASLAVAVCLGDQVLASLCMTTFGKSLSERVIQQNLPVLQDTAARIAAAFEG